MKVRIGIIVLVVAATAAFLRHSLASAILDPPVQGLKFYSLFVKSDSTNGFSYAVLSRPFAFTRTEQWPWQPCDRLREDVKRLAALREEDFPPPLTILKEPLQDGSMALVRSSSTILFLWWFPDFGGTAPSGEETLVCENRAGMAEGARGPNNRYMDSSRKPAGEVKR